MKDKIIQTVCRKWRVTYEEVCGRSRKRELVFARMTVAHFLREYMPLSTIEIGMLMCRDHCSVIYYLKTYKDEFRFNEEFRNFAESIKEVLDDIPKDPFALEMEEEFNEIYG